MSRILKIDLVWEIAEALGVEAPKMSTGSTEPKEIFEAVNRELGLGLSETLTKPDLARGIVEGSGHVWGPSFESAGGTVTFEGVRAVRDAVRFLMA